MSLIELEKIGIMGGGLNSALLCLEAKKKGIKTTIVDEDMYCPAANIADEHLVAPLNEESLLKLTHRVDAVVFTKKLNRLSDYGVLLQEGIPVYPDVELLEVLSSRQKFLWKMEQNDIAIAPYKKLQDELGVFEELKNKDLPVSITQYYKDISGPREYQELIIETEEDVVDLLMIRNDEIDYWLLEERAQNMTELSIAVTRDIKNKVYTYSISEDIYEKDKWIKSYIPARITKTLQNKATSLARRVIRTLEGVGAFTVKLSLTKDKELYVKEVLPYPIANAVYTNESCTISQYDHWIRVMQDMPLFSSEFNGVTFVNVEHKSEVEEINDTSQFLTKVGSNLYSFKGKLINDRTLLYTFVADTWVELEKNIREVLL